MNRASAEFFRLTGLAAACAFVAACSTVAESDLPAEQAAYTQFIPVEAASAATSAIGPRDVLRVTTYRQPDLSFERLRVDDSGSIDFPLVGTIAAQGKRPEELARDIEAALNRDYFKDAQVTVSVVEVAPAYVTVEGDVAEPGTVLLTSSRPSLLQVIAQAGSPTVTASLDRVAIFRIIEGERYGALFDLREIRAGNAPDPLIRPDDTIVVGQSGSKRAFRDFLQAAPLFNVFTRL